MDFSLIESGETILSHGSELLSLRRSLHVRVRARIGHGSAVSVAVEEFVRDLVRVKGLTQPERYTDWVKSGFPRVLFAIVYWVCQK